MRIKNAPWSFGFASATILAATLFSAWTFSSAVAINAQHIGSGVSESDRIEVAPAFAEPEPAAKAAAIAEKAAAFLRAQQDQNSGGWAVNPQAPAYPAITALALTGLVMDPKVDQTQPPTDPAVVNAVKFILKHRQPDGGIYDRVLPSYNTAICLSALSRINTPEAKAAVKAGVEFLKSLQFGEGAVAYTGLGESAVAVGKDHPFYGGWGYGRHGRPDLSNTAWALDALHDCGVDSKDPAFQRALVFLSRTQMVGTINDQPYAKGSTQGGFIYSTSVNKDNVGVGQSMAPEFEETLDDGTKVSRLRAYGSMTYAGFKSYVYAQLSKDDPRVRAAVGWLSRNYTLSENPGLGQNGMYYYYITLAKALAANGQPMIDVQNPDGTTGQRDWAKDLSERFAELQQPDGSFKKLDDRWMEDNAVLVAAYSLVALRHAGR